MCSDVGRAGSVDTGSGDVGVTVGDTVGVGVSGNNVGGEVGVIVGSAFCVSANAVPTVARAVSIILVVFGAGVDTKLLQEASVTIRNKMIIVLDEVFTFHTPLFCVMVNGYASHHFKSDDR